MRPLSFRQPALAVVRVGLLIVFLVGTPISAAERTIDGVADGIPKKITKAPPLPKEFAFTFSMPYGQGDEFPREPEEFDRMLGLLKSAGYNTVHCPYTDWRHELFKKHKMKMMIDVLAWKPPVEADIRDPAQREKVKAMCLKIKGSDAIWGYNLWNERLDWCGGFELLDAWIRMLRTWDSTHPIWVGTYRYLYCEHYPTNPGVHGWYDYHWARGMGWNLKMLNFYRGIAAKRQGSMGKWMSIEDYNRNLYTLNTSIAHGVKTIIWFIGGPYGPREPDKSKRWDKDSHLIRLGRHMEPLYGLIGQMGLPTAVYSTQTSRTPANKDMKTVLPADTTAFPKDHWLRIKQGEVIAGFFTLPDKSEVVYLANHNAYAWQGVVMDIQQDQKNPRILSEFDRTKGKWNKHGAVSVFNTAIAPGDAVVLRFEKPAPDDKDIKIIGEGPVQWNAAEHFTRIGQLLKDKGYVTDAATAAAAIYSTPTARTASNKDKPLALPAGTKAFPKDFWLDVKQGESLCGVFKLKDGGEAVCFANPNKYAWQGMLAVPKGDPKKPRMLWGLDQESGQWMKLGTWADVNFPLQPAGSTVIKFVPQK